MHLYTANQCRELDQKAISQQFNNDDFILMQRAGTVVYNKVTKLYPDCKNIIILCGQGNNGGDGFVTASLAAQNNYNVIVYFLGDVKKLSKPSLQAYNNFINFKNIKLVNNISELIEYTGSINTENTVYIDSLLGTGLSKAPMGEYKLAIDFLNTNNNIIAVDIPSGLDSNTGFAYNPAVKADYTISFIALKQGLYTQDGPDYAGKIFFDNLGVDENIYNLVDYSSWLISDTWANNLITQKLKLRCKNSHKHQFGHIVAVGGDNGMPGAIMMAGLAALRTGAGLCSIITNSKHSCEISQHHPELMVTGIEHGQDNDINKNKIIELLDKANVLILGPGLGQSDWSNFIFDTVVDFIEQNHSKLKAVIIDADGLNLLAKKNILFFDKLVNKLILTPHLGEAKNLLKPIEKVLNNNNISDLNNRFEIIKILADFYKATVILKGAGSLIYQEDSIENNKIAVCPFGNPGMATAGMGDILSGIIAGLVGQGLGNYDACCLAVYTHAKAGDVQADKFGQKGLIATDILLEIRKILNLKL